MRIQRLVLVGFLCALAARQSNAAVTFQKTADLSFGSIVAVPTGGTVTVSSLGSRTATSVVPIGSGFSPAAFTVTIPTGDSHYTIILPASAKLTDLSGNTMTVDAFESTPSNGKVDRATGGTASITVGATLHINGNQPAGSYSGTYLVMVSNP